MMLLDVDYGFIFATALALGFSTYQIILKKENIPFYYNPYLICFYGISIFLYLHTLAKLLLVPENINTTANLYVYSITIIIWLLCINSRRIIPNELWQNLHCATDNQFMPKIPLLNISISLLALASLIGYQAYRYHFVYTGEGTQYIPYWLYCLMSIYVPVLFAIFLSITNTFLKEKSWPSCFLWIITFFLIMITIRRITFMAIFFFLLLLKHHQIANHRFHIGKFIIYILIAALFFLGYATFFNQTRTWQHNFLTDSSTSHSPFKPLIEHNIDPSVTKNVEARPNIKDLIDTVVNKKKEHVYTYTKGDLFAGALKSTIPSLFYKKKSPVVTDLTIAHILKVPPKDFSDSLFAFLFIDFGWFSLIIMPLMLYALCLYYLYCLNILKKTPLLFVIFTAFILQYLFLTESNYIYYFVTFRNSFAIVIISISLQGFRKFYKNNFCLQKTPKYN